MDRKYFFITPFILLSIAISIQAAETFTDDFNTPHDYLVDGVIGTEWDGFFGLGENETVDVLDANITNFNSPNAIVTSGALFIQSTGSNWDTFNPYGPFLYKIGSGDFITEVEVVDIAGCFGSTWVGHNNSCIMARVPNLDDAGEGEDYVAICYFAAWCGHIRLSFNDGEKDEFGCEGGTCNDERFLQLERSGSTFYFRTSADGISWWIPFPPDYYTIERPDMAVLDLQVGLMHSVYSLETGYVAFNDFELTADAFCQHLNAHAPFPQNGATEVDPYTNLRWKSGEYVQDVNGHEVYLSTNFNDVNDANNSIKTVLTDANYVPGEGFFFINRTYYWRVDEVNDACSPYKWEGEVWSFTTEGKATNPDPYDGQGNISIEIAELKWTQTPLAVTQNFYFGDDEDVVIYSVTPTISDIPNDVNSVDISEFDLEPGKTYYWRIESVCGELGTSKGDVWEFSTWYKYMLCEDFEDWDWWIFFDGIVGSEYIIYIGTDINDGHLTIESMNGCWAGNEHGVLLYTDIAGDFAATVEISDFQGLYTQGHTDAVATNNAGIMARVSDLELAGPGEDWISIDYFPGWDVGIIIRYCDDGFRQELGNEETGWEADRFLQMERYDNRFVLSHSSDGSTYTQSPASPIFIEDMDGLALQVGLHHSICVNNISAWAEYDNFCVARNAIEKAYAPNPASGGMMDLMEGILSWTAGDFALEHRVYFSSEFNDVNERKPAADRGTEEVVDEGGGRFSYDAGYYETLAIGQSYYWCIDEINDPCVWPGDVWRFTVQNYSPIDNFEQYTGTGKCSMPPEDTLKSVWVDGNYSFFNLYPQIPIPGRNGSLVQLNTDTHDGNPNYAHYQPEDIAQSDGKSMKFYYDNDGYVTWESDLYNCFYPHVEPNPCNYIPDPDTYLSEAYAATDDAAAGSGLDSLDIKRDWSSYKVLKLSFYGDPNNGIEPMYIGLEDDDGTLVTIPYDGESYDVAEPWWHDWYVALSEFTDKDAGLNLSEIIRIYIGFGDKDNPSPGGTGLVFFDDILLFATPQCVPDSVLGDFDGDCMVNYSDLELFSYNFPGETPSLPTPIIQLVATGTVGADVTSWTNTGSLGGTFTDVNATDANNPVVGEILGKKCVTFDDVANALVWDQNAPATLTSDTNEPNDYTVIYEVYNPSIANEEWLFNWAVRGGPVRTCAGVGYGSNAEFGCIVHWDPPGDMGFDAGVPAAEQWHVIAATYDGTTNAVIVDGLVHSTEDKDLLVRMDQPVTVGAPYAIPGDPNTAYILGTYVPSYTNFRFTGSVASIRVYAEAVPPGDLAIVTATMAGLPRAEADVKPDSKIDFGDLAVLGNKWMQAPELLE